MSDVISPLHTARRIAGHADAAHGDTVLWIIGLDEKHGLTNPPQVEFLSWWQQVQP